MKNKFLLIALAAIIGFSFASLSLTGCDDGGGTTTVPVTGVTLNQSSISLNVSGSATLIATVTPDNAKNKTVSWSTSNPAAATVSNGVVTAVAAGTATITVTTADGGKTATCTVTVTGGNSGTPDLSGNITINPSTGVNINTELTATYSGSETVSYQWKKVDANVGTNSNKFTPTTAGSYTVTVSATGYNSKTSAVVDVNDPSLLTLSGTITISPNSGVTVNTQLTATYSGSETVSYQWEKDGSSVGTNSNKYTPTTAGSYTVTVSASGYNSKTSAVVDVNDPSLSTLSGTITINPNNGVTVNTQLTATYSGSETVSYQWEKNGNSVGTNSNKYTPTTAGSYTVTVSATGYNSKTSNAITVTGGGTQGTAPTITTTTLENGIPGAWYGQEIKATGSTPITWSIESGALPGGLSLNDNAGTIYGYPTTVLGTSTFTVKATNSAGSVTKQLSITIANVSIDGKTFTSIAEFAALLELVPANTASTPYSVKLNISDLGGDYRTSWSLGNALKNNETKYVCIDLSDSTITTIPDYAFYDNYRYEGCKTLIGITIPDSVISIGEKAFYDNNDNLEITWIYNPALTKGSYSDFSDHLKNVTIPYGVTTISDWSLSSKLITSITIPDSVTSIGEKAFYNCTNLASIIIPNSVTSIGDNAFIDCSNLTSVTIPNSVTSIGSGAFVRCTSLTSLIIGSGVTSIGDWAFSYCGSLTSVRFEKAGIRLSLSYGGATYSVGFVGISSFEAAYSTGGIGTYTRPNTSSTTWTKVSN